MNSPVNEYDKGDLVRIFTTFVQENGGMETPVDPGTVKLRVLDPLGGESIYDYAEEEITRDGAGTYHRDVTPQISGEWHYRWESTGAGQGAEEGRFFVRHTPFT